MKKLLITCLLTILTTGFVSAQNTEFKIAMKSGVLQMSLNNVSIQGYDGNEIIFTSPIKKDEKPDPRAKGLTLLGESGLKDNTGLDLNVQRQGNTVQVNYVSKNQSDSIVVKVPNTVSLNISSNAVFTAGGIAVENYKGELEISSSYSPIRLNNVTGPIAAKTLYSELTATLTQPVKGPISLVSVYGLVDLTLPSNLKANVAISTQYGNIYADEALNLQTVAKTPTNSVFSPTSISGTLNGGGVNLSIQSTYGKIYLRKS